MFDQLEKLKNLFKDEKETGFFRNVIKGLAWVLGVSHFDELEARAIRRIKQLRRSRSYRDIKVLAAGFASQLRSRLLWLALFPIAIGWTLYSICVACYYIGDNNVKFLHVGLTVALATGVFGAVVLTVQATKAYIIMWVVTGLERIADAAVEKLADTLPDVFFTRERLNGKDDPLKMELQSVTRKIWLPPLVVLVTHLLLVIVVWAINPSTINGFSTMFVVVTAVMALVMGALAFNRDPAKFDRLSEALPKKMVIVSIVFVALIPITRFAWSAIQPYVERWEIRHAVLEQRAEAAKADALATNAAIQKIEEEVLKKGTMTETQREEMAKLRKRLAWNATGRAKTAPLPPPPPPAAPPPPTPTCSDGVDNDKDGYVDKDSHKCYLVAINCSKADKRSGACVDRFANWQNGKQVKDLWFRYNPNGDEKVEPKWTTDVLAAEKARQNRPNGNGGGSNGKGGNGAKNQAKVDQELAAIDACFKLGSGCKL